MDAPFAWFITWTTYGTWLPGDKRGYVSDTFAPRGKRIPKQNIPGTPITKDSAYTRRLAAHRQKYDTIWLNVEQALVVAEALVEAANDRNWHIRRAAVMAGHIRALVWDCPDDGEAVRRILKGVSQAKLSDFAGKNRRWFTRGGSDRRRSGTRSLTATENYIANQAGKLVEIIAMEIIRHR